MAEFRIEAVLSQQGAVRSAGDLDKSLGRVKDNVKGVGEESKKVQQQNRGPGGFLGFTDQDLKKIEEGLRGVGTGLTTVGTGIAAFGAGIVGGLGLSVSAFTSFDAAMNQSLAIMGDVDEALRVRMVEAARVVAVETQFSAEQAAESYFFLASAGLDAAASIEALPVVAKFAQAGMFDMALATDLLTDAQSALGLTIRDDAVKNMENMIRVSDVLVKANTLANATVQQFSESLTNKAAAALRIVNKDVEEGVAVLAAFADQGLKGAAAGEALNIVTRDLQRAALDNKNAFREFGLTVFDTNGKMRNYADIIGDLEGLLGGMSDEHKRATVTMLGFQDRSVSNLLTLIGTSDAIRDYESELRKAAGTTDEVSQKQLQTFNAQLGLLKDSVVDVAISVGQAIVPALSRMVDAVRPVVLSIADWTRENPGLTQGIVGLVAVLGGGALTGGGLLLVLGGVAHAIANVLPLLKAFKEASAAAAGADGVGFLASALRTAGGTGGAIGIFGAAFAAMIAVTLANLAELKAEMEKTFGELIPPEAIKEANDLRGALDSLGLGVKQLAGETTKEWIVRLKDAAKENGILRGSVKDLGFGVKETTVFIEGIGDVTVKSGGQFGKAGDAAGRLGINIKTVGEVAKQSGGSIAGLTANTDKLIAVYESVNEVTLAWADQAKAAAITRAEAARIEEQNKEVIQEIAIEMDALNRQLKQFSDQARLSALSSRELGRAFFEAAVNGQTLTQNMRSSAVPALDALGMSALQQRDALGRFTGEFVKVDQAATNTKSVMNQVSTAITDLGKEIADIIVDGGKLTDVFESFGKALLRIVTENIIGVLIGQLGTLLKMVPGLAGLGGVLSGTAGRATGGAAGLGGLAAFGGPIGLLAGGVAAGGALGGVGGAVVGGVGTAFGIGAASGIAAGGGLGALSPIAALGPWGAAIAGGALATVAIAKLLSKSVAEKFATEFARDFGNVRIPESTIKQFISGLGIDEKALEPIRKDIASSPLFLDIGLQAAQAQGRVNEFLESLENVGTAWGSADFRAAFEFGKITGDFTELNRLFVDLFGKSTELVEVFGEGLKPLLIDMGEDFVTLSDRIKGMAEAGSPLETIFAKFRNEIVLTLDAAAGVGLLLDPVVEQFRDMAIATADWTDRQVDLVSQLATTRAFVPEMLDQFAGEIEFLKSVGASSSEIFVLLGNDIEQVANLANQLGIEIPDAVKPFLDFGKTAEEIWNSTVAAAKESVAEITEAITMALSSTADVGGDAAELFGDSVSGISDAVSNELDEANAQIAAWLTDPANNELLIRNPDLLTSFVPDISGVVQDEINDSNAQIAAWLTNPANNELLIRNPDLLASLVPDISGGVRDEINASNAEIAAWLTDPSLNESLITSTDLVSDLNIHLVETATTASQAGNDAVSWFQQLPKVIAASNEQALPDLTEHFENLAGSIQTLINEGYSLEDISLVLGGRFLNLVEASRLLGYALPPIVDDLYDIGRAAETAGQELARSKEIFDDAAGAFASGFDSIGASVENLTLDSFNLAGQWEGLIQLMTGNGISAVDASSRAWGLLGDSAIRLFNQFVLFGQTAPQWLQDMINIGVAAGEAAIGFDGFASSVDQAAGKMRVINGEWVLLGENITNAANTWGAVDPDFREQLGFGDPGGTPGPSGPILDPNHPFFPFGGQTIPAPPQPGPDVPPRGRAFVPSFQLGGIMPHTGLAFLHKGETVLPPGQTVNNSENLTVNVSLRLEGSQDPRQARSFVRQFAGELERQLPRVLKRDIRDNKAGIAVTVRKTK